MRRTRKCVAAAGALGMLWACATRPFDRSIAEGRWAEAAQLFAADSSLVHDPDALYSAGVLFGTPSRPTYDPERARGLFRRLFASFPDSKHAEDAQVRVALLDDVVRARSTLSRVRELEARLAELTAQQGRLRAQLDSAQSVNENTRGRAARLEADVHDRDEQLRALRLELKQLKEIDLKPRSPVRKPQ